MKCEFFRAVSVSVLLYNWNIWILTIRVKKKLDENSKSMLRAVLNRFWKFHSSKQVVVVLCYFLSISKNIQDEKYMLSTTWKVKDKLIISNVLPWTTTHRHINVGWKIKTYIHQLCADTECLLEDRLRAMAEKTGCQWKFRESVLSTYLDNDWCILTRVLNLVVIIVTMFQTLYPPALFRC